MNPEVSALHELYPDRVKDIEFLDDSTEFDLIKNLFFKIDWLYSGMGMPTGKDFSQIVWYCENLGYKNGKTYIPILHTMGRMWLNAQNSGEREDGKNT